MEEIIVLNCSDVLPVRNELNSLAIYFHSLSKRIHGYCSRMAVRLTKKIWKESINRQIILSSHFWKNVIENLKSFRILKKKGGFRKNVRHTASN